MAVLVHLRVIVYQLAVQCKAQRCYESQSRHLKKVKKLTARKLMDSDQPVHYMPLPFNIPRAALECMDTSMVSYDGIVYASLQTGVARYCNNLSCYKGWEVYLGHR